MDPTIIGFAIVIVTMLILHVLHRRALARLRRLVERQLSMGETAAARGSPVASQSGRILRPATTALERVHAQQPVVNQAASDRVPRIPSPRVDEEAIEAKRPATSRHVPRGAEWTPTHRITFTADNGKAQSWLVAIVPAPYGHRIAVTHAEWAAGVTPAWHCAADGVWSCHGLRTPDGARGRISIDEFSGSSPISPAPG